MSKAPTEKTFKNKDVIHQTMPLELRGDDISKYIKLFDDSILKEFLDAQKASTPKETIILPDYYFDKKGMLVVPSKDED